MLGIHDRKILVNTINSFISKKLLLRMYEYPRISPVYIKFSNRFLRSPVIRMIILY